MQVKRFKPDDIEAMNEFMASVEMPENRVEFNDGWLYVFYKESTKQDKLRQRIREAQFTLMEAELHREFLDVIDIGDEDKIKEAQEKNDKEIKNAQARIQRYEECLMRENSSNQ